MKLTIKEFSDKYQIPYKTVFRASRVLPKPADAYTHFGYNERELVKAVANDLKARRERARKTAIEANEELKVLAHGMQMQKL